MKKLFIPFVLLGVSLNAQITTFPWTETFETSSTTAAEWTKIYESGTQEWSNVTTAYYGYTTGAYQGDLMAEFDIDSFDGDATKYVSPILNLSSVNSPTLEFYYRNKDWGGDQNELKVYYRTSTTGTWTLITTFNSSISDWTNSGTLTLPSPSATYQIALEGVAWYGCSINVDDVLVKSGILSTSEFDKKKNTFKVYPNPTSDFINIKSEKRISEVLIFDLAGKRINQIKEDNNEIKIPVHQLPTGTYIIQIKNTEGMLNFQKFIKK
ncbi:T9SS type A sorting domain-containing protein [Chryseobacterium aahli]|uniref:T9SS type A sorting domain-containing protein n=1 Tax=Chryseobacterium aahli TaxID=1278643 RepID=UPI001F60F98F|nr:T9SS type A sorting domain-containing protein [Chryseobacterium aahli]MCI3937492.1 T9SS type A sorting domain-containing protein [Chryseobacterium aahli]